MDNLSNRGMIADLIKDGIKHNNSTFPEQDSFIARVSG